VSDPVGGAPRDAALVAFVDAIEGVLRARRGAEHVLSPRDFALARSWHEAGIPLAAVLVAIDLAFEADPRTSSLAGLRRRVEELAAAGPRTPGPAREAERLALPEVGERLAELRERLLELPGRVSGRVLVDVDEVADLVAVSQRPNWDYLRARLRQVDEAVAAVAVEALAPAEAEAVRSEATHAAGRHRGRIDERSLEEAVARLVRQRARERLRLPRVSLD
jgi:hypothetical protein